MSGFARFYLKPAAPLTQGVTSMPPAPRTSSALRFASLTLLLVVASITATAQPTPRPDRRIALTFDDLPFVFAARLPAADVDAMTDRFLGSLRSRKAPAIGFVNEGTLDSPALGPGGRDRQMARLTRWLDAGFPLGNHTFSHHSLSTTPPAEYEADVLRGETVTRALMTGRGLTLTWFRHPFTHTGPTAEVRTRFEAFLTQHGYRIAPFTIENADYVFNAIHPDHGDAAEHAHLERAYLDHVEETTRYFEALSVKVFGREIPQILLAHANQINSETMDRLLARFEARGYRFVTLDEVMRDEAYRTEDRFVGTYGPSWLYRWAIARGVTVSIRDEPDPPQWVMERYKQRSAAH